MMEELYARIEALERRLERAEAALRDREARGLWLPSVRPFSERCWWGLPWVWGLLVGPAGDSGVGAGTACGVAEVLNGSCSGGPQAVKECRWGWGSPMALGAEVGWVSALRMLVVLLGGWGGVWGRGERGGSDWGCWAAGTELGAACWV